MRSILSCLLVFLVFTACSREEAPVRHKSETADVIFEFADAPPGIVPPAWGDPGQEETTVESRLGNFDYEAFNALFPPAAESSGFTFGLRLFEDTVLHFSVDSFENRDDKTTVISGTIESEFFGQGLMTVSPHGMFATFQQDNRLFEVIPASEGVVTIAEINQGSFPEDEVLLPRKDPGQKVVPSDPIESGDPDPEGGPVKSGDPLSVALPARVEIPGTLLVDPGRIKPLLKVLVLLPEPAFNHICARHYPWIFPLIETAMENHINSVWRQYARSEVTIDCIRYTPEGNNNDLLWLEDDAGVATLRNDTESDMVALIVPDFNSCGVARRNVLPVLSTEHENGFAVVKRSCILSNYSLEHELGHVMGMAHDDPAPPLNECHFGYHVNIGRSWGRTVLAKFSNCDARSIPRSKCPRYPFHSTPNAFDVPEIPAGTDVGNACGLRNGAHNYAQLNAAAPVVAQYR